MGGTDDDDLDRVGQDAIEGRSGAAAPAPAAETPAAGPHETPALTEPDATPGTGSLPAPTPGGEADAGTG